MPRRNKQYLIAVLIISIVKVNFNWHFKARNTCFRLKFIDINLVYKTEPINKLLFGYKKVRFEYYQQQKSAQKS